MKAKSVLHLLGLRPKPRRYGYEIIQFNLPTDGPVYYAQWLHPKDARKEVQQADVDLVREFVARGDAAIDIGAYTGDSTLPIALAAGTEGQVLALEPNPYVYKILVKNVELNASKVNIEPLRFAAAREDGPVEFEYSDPGFCNGGRHEGVSPWVHGHAFKLTIEGRNLDTYLRRKRPGLLDRLRYIKIDAEGYDLEILKSIRGILADVRPYIKTEVYKYATVAQRLELARLFRDLGYRLYRVIDGSNYFGDVVDEDNVMNWRHYDVLGVPESSAVATRRAA